MVNAVLSKIPSFPQSPYPATSSPGTTSFSPRKAGSDLKALLPQPPTPSSALACPISVQAAQLQPPPLCWWRCRGTAQTPCWNPGVPTCCASGLYHYLAHQYLLVLATHFQVSFHINYCSLISLTALKQFDRSHLTLCLHLSSPLVLLSWTAQGLQQWVSESCRPTDSHILILHYGKWWKSSDICNYYI